MNKPECTSCGETDPDLLTYTITSSEVGQAEKKALTGSERLLARLKAAGLKVDESSESTGISAIIGFHETRK